MKWISVEDRLPEEEIDILAWGRSNKNYRNGECFHFIVQRMNNDMWITQDFDAIEDVFYWMPLPPEPV